MLQRTTQKNQQIISVWSRSEVLWIKILWNIKGKERKHGRYREMIEIRLQGKACNDGSNNTYNGNLKEMLGIKLQGSSTKEGR